MKIIQTRTHLAFKYGCNYRTISKWLRLIGITHRRALSPDEIQRFIEHYGTPEQLKDAQKLLQ